MIVVDAGVLATALVDCGPGGELARSRLRGEELVAPEVVDLEVAATLRWGRLSGGLDSSSTRQALADLVDLPLRRVSHCQLLPRCWELARETTPHDAAYLATAELYGLVLVTADRQLAATPGRRCRVELVG